MELVELGGDMDLVVVAVGDGRSLPALHSSEIAIGQRQCSIESAAFSNHCFMFVLLGRMWFAVLHFAKASRSPLVEFARAVAVGLLEAPAASAELMDTLPCCRALDRNRCG